MVFFTTRFLIFLAFAGTFLAMPFLGWSQPFNDPCFTSPAISTTFAPTANVSNNNADCMSWNGAGWTGSWGGANITLAPPGGTIGTRAIWSGDGTVWTSGGEGFGLRLTSSIVTGTTYTFSYRRVSHGTGQNGNFQPAMYTNTTGTFGYLIGNIPGVGTAWTNTVISFTAVAAQSGHTFVYFHNSSGSGMFLACLTPVLPMSFFDFQGWNEADDVALTWKTMNEGEFITHAIDMSLDGINFSEMDRIPALHSEDEALDYEWSRNAAALGISEKAWFRIRSITSEGQETFSPVIEISVARKQSVIAHLQPNPTASGENALLKIYAEKSEPVHLQIHNYEGQLVSEFDIDLVEGLQEFNLPSSGIQPGMYLIRLTKGGIIQRLRWMVQ